MRRRAARARRASSRAEGAPYQAGAGRRRARSSAGWRCRPTSSTSRPTRASPWSRWSGSSPDGIITGARVIHHSEPILLVGIPEQALHDFVAFYAGRPRSSGSWSVGPASPTSSRSTRSRAPPSRCWPRTRRSSRRRARSARRSASSRLTTVSPGHFVAEHEAWTFGADARAGRARAPDRQREPRWARASGQRAVRRPVLRIADAPQVGRALLGDHDYAYEMEQPRRRRAPLRRAERGDGSFKGSALRARRHLRPRPPPAGPARDHVPRHRLQQPARAPRPKARRSSTRARCSSARRAASTPAHPTIWSSSAAATTRRAPSHASSTSSRPAISLPDSIYRTEKRADGIPWRQAWSNRRVDVVVLVVYLLFVIGVFSARRYTTADPDRGSERLHLASVIFGFVMLGVYMRAQPSVTQILTVVGSLFQRLALEPVPQRAADLRALDLHPRRVAHLGTRCLLRLGLSLRGDERAAFKLTHRFGWKSLELPDGSTCGCATCAT